MTNFLFESGKLDNGNRPKSKEADTFRGTATPASLPVLISVCVCLCVHVRVCVCLCVVYVLS